MGIAEQIQSLAGQLEETIRRETKAEFIEELQGFLSTVDAHEVAGLGAAIEILKQLGPQ